MNANIPPNKLSALAANQMKILPKCLDNRSTYQSLLDLSFGYDSRCKYLESFVIDYFYRLPRYLHARTGERRYRELEEPSVFQVIDSTHKLFDCDVTRSVTDVLMKGDIETRLCRL